jgi:HPt (histidine-containing phosphotransfer) domain-containing protein
MSRFSEEELDQYTIAVHGLKGASFNIHAEDVGNFAASLEAAARSGDIATIKAQNKDLIEATETLISSLNELLAKTEKSRDKKRRSISPDPMLLNRLFDASKQYRPALMEEAITELEKYEYDSGGDLVLWLREQFENLEYEAIQECLENENGLKETAQANHLPGED